MGYVLFGAGDKAEHLPRLKIAYTAFKRGSTECAAHAAAHLSRYAHGVAVVIAHKHALDYIAVLKLKQVLYSTVLSRHPFIIYACAAVMERVQLIPELLWQIGHFLRPFAPGYPFKYLPCTKFRLPKLFHEPGKLGY